MKANRKLTTGIVTGALVLLTAGVVMAGHGYASSGCHGGGHAAILRTLIELNVTEAQKQDVAQILKAHRDDVSSLVDDVANARLALFEAIHAESFDEQAVRDASRSVAKAQEELAVQRARIVQEARSVLTEEQRTLIESRRDIMLDGAVEKLETVRELINAWIDKTAGQ